MNSSRPGRTLRITGGRAPKDATDFSIIIIIIIIIEFVKGLLIAVG